MADIDLSTATAANTQTKHPLGFWLRFFLIMNIIGAVGATFKEFIDCQNAINQNAAVATAGYSVIALEVVWNIIFIYSMISVLSMKKGAIKFIKKMLIISPLINILIPIVTGIMLVITVNGFALSADFIKEVYDFDAVKGIIQSVVASLIWYTYFSKAKRIKNVWHDDV